MDKLKQELRDYYINFRRETMEQTLPEADRAAREIILADMDKFLEANPEIHPSLLKAHLHELIAENFVPKIFPHSPFFYETGMRPAEYWGIPMQPFIQPASWMSNRFKHLAGVTKEAKYCSSLSLHNQTSDLPPLWSGSQGFDEDHHCPGYTTLMRTGVSGILDKISLRQQEKCSEEQLAELDAMERSCRALLRIAERFTAEAKRLLKNETDPESISNLELIARTARRIPANPPQTFYEGLAMLWFLREVIASLEGVGISVIGHTDRLLIDLYRDDIAADRLTEDAARKLIGQWMMPNDIKTFAREREWPETSTCIMLGGCDKNGDFVWNELTRMFIEEHCRLDLINPKLNCRISAGAPQEYLELLVSKNLEGHNNFALINDDVLIPAQIKYGKTPEDARLYVNGGCQETMCEGVEHTAGAYYYFCMPQFLHLFLSRKRLEPEGVPTGISNAINVKLSGIKTYDEFYKYFTDSLKLAIGTGAELNRNIGEEYPRINPCPLFSASLSGCIENARDYKSGGAKYNLSGITLIGLGDIVNSLIAIKHLVFESHLLSLEELRKIIDSNWENNELLRMQAQSLPRYGHGIEEGDIIATRFASEIAAYIRTLPNERGEHFQPSFFVYATYKTFGTKTGATPDGRLAGDLLSQGIAPHREHAPQSLTDVIRTIDKIDFTDYPGNAVLDLQLPAGGKIPPEMLVSFCRVAATAGVPTLQLNCVDVKTLQEAQKNPEAYSHVLVRFSGLSIVFVKLEKSFQDEIISRTMYAV